MQEKPKKITSAGVGPRGLSALKSTFENKNSSSKKGKVESEERAPITRRNSKKLQLEGCTPGLRVNDAASVFEKKAAQPPTPSIFRRNSTNSNSPSKWGGHSPSKSGDSQKGDMPFGGNTLGLEANKKSAAQPAPNSSSKEAKNQLLGNSYGGRLTPNPTPSPTPTLSVTSKPVKAEASATSTNSLSPTSAATEKPKPTSSPKSKTKSKEASSSKAKNAVAKAILAAETATHPTQVPATPDTPVASSLSPTTPVTPKTPVTNVTSPMIGKTASEAPKAQATSPTQSAPTVSSPDPTGALTPPTVESSKDKEAKLAAVGVISREIFKSDGGAAAKNGRKAASSSTAAASGNNQVPATANQVTDGDKTKSGHNDTKKAVEKASKRSPSATRRQQSALEPLKIAIEEQPAAKGVPSEAAQVSVAKVKTIEPLVEDSKVSSGIACVSNPRSDCL